MSSVSVIICTRNRASDLRKTLARLSTHPVPTEYPVDMWVVDNGSTDETPDVVSEAAASFPFRLNYAREETQGVAYARNKALRVSGGDILLFTDDDVRVPKNWIDGMTRSIRHNSFDAAAGGVRLAPHLVRPWMEPWHRAFLACTDPKTRPPQTMIGANMAFSRTVLSTVPAFDTHVGPGRLGFAEETHFAERLLRAGYRIADAFDVEVEHHCDPSRLHRTSFLSSAERLGRTMAHLHYHWRHKQTPFTDRATQIYIKLAKTYVKLSIKRMLNPRDVFRTEGCASWENYYVRECAYLKQSLIERKTARRYAKYGAIPLKELQSPEHVHNGAGAEPADMRPEGPTSATAPPPSVRAS